VISIVVTEVTTGAMGHGNHRDCDRVTNNANKVAFKSAIIESRRVYYSVLRIYLPCYSSNHLPFEHIQIN
jgi:hypothetical protein